MSLPQSETKWGRASRRRVTLLALAVAAFFVALVTVTAPGRLAIASQPAAALVATGDVAGLRPGGAATSRGSVDNRNAFSQSSGNLSFAHEFDFKLGNAIFRKLWVSAPASTSSSDGLGPLFNARSCQRCHLKDGRGHPPTADWPADNAISMLLKLSVPPGSDAERAAVASGRLRAVAEPTYGLQLQDNAIQGHAAEGRIKISYTEQVVTLAGGERVTLRKPSFTVSDLGYGAMAPGTMLSPRIAPQMIGLGLLEAIASADIVVREDPDDRDGDGVSGRASHTVSLVTGKADIGRFGWKAAVADVPSQTAMAFSGDMGLSTDLLPAHSGECAARQSACLGAPHGASANTVEVPKNLFDLVVFYARNLAVPARRNAADPDVVRGGALFRDSGCAACHVPAHRTGESAASANLAGQLIWPFTDMLLHDMGPGLADNRPEGSASGVEWRTAPLWGIGLTQEVSGHTFLLHDGRARNVEEAILWHAGEALGSRDRYARLGKADRKRLIAFVNSL